MKIIHFAGTPNSGKTSIIKESGLITEKSTIILNNDESSELIGDLCERKDVFPFKSPCARVRQYSYRIELLENSILPDILITEPPGNCMDVSSPMINAIFVSKRDKFQFGPLFTVIEFSTILENKASKRSTDGLRTHNMIYESDVVIVSKSDSLDNEKREEISGIIKSVNEDAEIVFASIITKEGLDKIKELALNSEYHRPLVN